MLKQDPTLQEAISCQLDPELPEYPKETHRFTFGKLNEEVSGAVYFKKGTTLPKMLILMLDLKGVEHEEVNSTECGKG